MSPFKSQAQRAFMYSQHPEIAKRWRKEYGPQKNLPEHKREKEKSLAKKAHKMLSRRGK